MKRLGCLQRVPEVSDFPGARFGLWVPLAAGLVLLGCASETRSYTRSSQKDAASADGGYNLPESPTLEDAGAAALLPDGGSDAATAAAAQAQLDAEVIQVAAPDASGVATDPSDSGGPPPLASDSGTPSVPEVEVDASAPEPIVLECTIDGDCDDGNACNGSESCAAGACVSGEHAGDGTVCELTGFALTLVCSQGNCTPSTCGDGFVDERTEEICDDGNDVSGDGCEANCTFTCTQAEDCSDSDLCNGDELCDVESHTCSWGEPAPDQTPCSEAAECNAARCLPIGCGNGIVDSTEQCDDSNLDDGDGCDADCTFTCSEDVDCDDANVCTGLELCDTETHACVTTEPLNCDDGSACTENLCDAVSGCYFVTHDADGDGVAASELGECGTDCDDGNASVHPSAQELCDGIDNDCDDLTDETATTWYRDCDGDGFAPSGAPHIQNCTKPGTPNGCDAGLAASWTSKMPTGDDVDCWDTSAQVNPSIAGFYTGAIPGREASVDYDYNCDRVEEPKQYQENAARLDCRGIILDPGPIITDPPILLPAAAVGCSGTAGWAGSAPTTCGTEGKWATCKTVSGTCTRVTDSTKTLDCH